VLVEGQGAADDSRPVGHSGSMRSGAPLIVGRSFRDAPEVDGQVFAWGTVAPGSFATVRITQALDYDLWGQLV